MAYSTYTISVTTFICSLLSVIGSLVVLISYIIARTTTKPRPAQLIRNLAAADLFWFLGSLLESSFWLSGSTVPNVLCFICSPLIIFLRIASLIWTCAISFDVLMSVNKRKWVWNESHDSMFNYRNMYFVIVVVLSLPGALLNMIKQHATNETDLGCSPSYESLGNWYIVFFTELLPIMLGFLFNVIVYCCVRQRMSLKSYPQSVRKRRRKIMYHYIVVCILCWFPTIVFYLFEIISISQTNIPFFEIFARASLYLTGFFNFLVFGMQDPHLKRSFSKIVSFGRIALKMDVDKSVMFEESTVVSNADIPKNKRSIYKNNKLSKEDKISLYMNRPDLDPDAESDLNEPLLDSSSISGSSSSSGGSISSSGSNNNNDGSNVDDASHINVETEQTSFSPKDSSFLLSLPLSSNITNNNTSSNSSSTTSPQSSPFKKFFPDRSLKTSTVSSALEPNNHMHDDDSSDDEDDEDDELKKLMSDDAK